MACFVAPTVMAIAGGIINHRIKKREKTVVTENVKMNTSKIPFSKKLSWLNTLLLGGSFLLLIEHIWHGEIVAYFPFLTAMESMFETQQMLLEILTVGVGMSVLCTAVWGVMLGIVHILEKKNSKLVKKLCA